jgi:hypothetical protein
MIMVVMRMVIGHCWSGEDNDNGGHENGDRALLVR